MKRIHSIDVLRALAILFMVLCHVPVFLSPADNDWPWLYFFSNHVVGDFAAPLFLFLVGVSVTLSSAHESGHLWKRGVAIFCVGLCFSILVRGLSAVFEWDVLTLIGTSIVVLHFLRHAPNWSYPALCAVIFGATPWLRGMVDYMGSWGGTLAPVAGIQSVLPGFLVDPIEEYHPGGTLIELAQGFFLEGYFPLFPWLVFPLSGVWVGRVSFIQEWRGPTTNKWIGASGLAFSVLGAAVGYASREVSVQSVATAYLTPLSFYPNVPSMLLLQLGVTLLLFALARSLYDQKNEEGVASKLNLIWIRYCTRLSRYSLSVYFFHHILIYWPMWGAGWMAGNLEKYNANSLSVPAAFFSALVLLFALGPFLIYWDQKKAKWSLEWLLKKLYGGANHSIRASQAAQSSQGRAAHSANS